MPTISMFFGIIIRMYWNDHMPPHFHAYYQGDSAVFDLDGNVLEGGLPRKQLPLLLLGRPFIRTSLKPIGT